MGTASISRDGISVGPHQKGLRLLIDPASRALPNPEAPTNLSSSPLGFCLEADRFRHIQNSVALDSPFRPGEAPSSSVFRNMGR
jgi:hypothetical protein